MDESIVRGGRVAPGAGEARWVGGECLTLKVRGVDSQGAVAIVESTVQPGYAPPLHIHLHESEAFYILEGEFVFTIGDQEIPAPAGSLISVPRGRLHRFRNAGSAPGKMLIVFWPAVAFEDFVAEVGTPQQLTEPPDVARLAAAATRHGIVVPPQEGL